MVDKKSKPKKIGARLVFSWIFSLIFLLVGLSLLIQVQIAPGIFFLLAGMVIDPAFIKFIRNKFNIKLSRWLIFFSMLIFLIVAFSTISYGFSKNLGNEESASNSVQNYRIGETFTLGNFKYTINSVEQKTNIIGAMGYLTKEGNFLIVDLTLENVGNEAEYINDELYIVDAQNREFESDSEYMFYVDNYLSSIDKINPGLTQSGQLIFEVPADIEGKIGIKESLWSSKFGAFVDF